MAPPPGIHVIDRAPDGGGEGTQDAGTDGHGAEEPLLIAVVHGAMDRSASFGRIDRRLRDRHVVRYDRRGYGRSRAAGVGEVSDHTDDLLAVLDGRPAVVFGHSIGGVVALAAASRRPGLVRGVLAYEPPTPWAPWWPADPPVTDAAGIDAAAGADTDGVDPGEVAVAFMRRAVGDRIWERLPSRTRQDRRDEGVALLADQQSLARSRPYEPALVTVPVVVAVGSETTWWHRRAGEELSAQLPRSELTVVDGAQHGVHLSHPAEVVVLLDQLLSRVQLERSLEA